MNIKELKASYKDTLKSMDTEETIDLCFYRPIGYMWAVLCAKLGIKPNAITIASIFIGVAAGVMFYFDDLWLNIVGGVVARLGKLFRQCRRSVGAYDATVLTPRSYTRRSERRLLVCGDLFGYMLP